jgi:hypothetical protein
MFQLIFCFCIEPLEKNWKQEFQFRIYYKRYSCNPSTNRQRIREICENVSIHFYVDHQLQAVQALGRYPAGLASSVE